MTWYMGSQQTLSSLRGSDLLLLVIMETGRCDRAQLTGPGCNLKLDISVSNSKGSSHILLGWGICVYWWMYLCGPGHMCMCVHELQSVVPEELNGLFDVVSQWDGDSPMRRLTGQQVPGVFPSLPPQSWDYKNSPQCPAFKWALETELRHSCLQDKQTNTLLH